MAAMAMALSSVCVVFSSLLINRFERTEAGKSNASLPDVRIRTRDSAARTIAQVLGTRQEAGYSKLSVDSDYDLGSDNFTFRSKLSE